MVQEFMSITGASAEVAGASLASCNNDLERAVAAFFDSATDAAAMDDDAVDEDAPAAPAAVLPPPLDNSADLVKSILDGAAKPEDEPPSWSAGGRALGSAAADDEPAPAPDAAPAAAERTNPKKVRVIFWADGFTVEDVGDEEAEAAQAAAAPAAPRRTGLATLGSAAERAADQPQMPKLPPLRKYEDNVKFMEDLKKGIPPLELREIDLSTGAPRARPVDIMLGDLRPAPYPAEAAKRQAAMSAAPPPTATLLAFGGAGQTLGGPPAAATSASSETSGAGSAAATGTWERASLDAPQVDLGAPTTDVQVRLAGGEVPPQRLKLNRTHTVTDLLTLLEQTLQAAGVAGRPYVLMDGFPPKPLAASDASLQEAGLINAAVTLRWS